MSRHSTSRHFNMLIILMIIFLVIVFVVIFIRFLDLCPGFPLPRMLSLGGRLSFRSHATRFILMMMMVTAVIMVASVVVDIMIMMAVMLILTVVMRNLTKIMQMAMITFLRGDIFQRYDILRANLLSFFCKKNLVSC